MTEVFSAYLPIWPYRRDYFRWPDIFDEMTDKLLGKSFSCPRDGFAGGGKWSVRRSVLPSAAIDVLLKSNRRYREGDLNDAVEIIFEFDRTPVSEIRKQITPAPESDEDCIYYWRHFRRELVKDEVSIINFAMDLAIPGGGFRGPYALISDGHVGGEDVWSAYIDDVYEDVSEFGFSWGGEIQFDLVWSALSRINGLRNGVSDTNFGKLIVALTHIYAGAADGVRFSKIVWACYGLEGFFAEGAAARGRQISEAISLFLDIDRDLISKKLKLLYEYRSKFIHGNKSLSSSLVDLDPDNGNFSKEEWDVEHVGVFLLMESARECIRRGIREQKFKLILG